MNRTQLKVLREVGRRGGSAGFATHRDVDAALALRGAGLLEVTCDRYLMSPHIGVKLTAEGVAKLAELAPVHVDLGDIVVCKGFRGVNPYKDGLIGSARSRALHALFTEGGEPGHSYWHAPASGGARRIRPRSLPRLQTIDASGKVRNVGSYWDD